MAMAPPYDPPPEEIVLSRQPYGRNIELFLSSNESFVLSVEKVHIYLRLLGFDDPHKVLDTVWNFFAIWIDVQTKHYEIVPRHAVDEVLRDATKTKARRALATIFG